MLSNFYTNTITQITGQEASIATLQQQLGTGLAVPTAGTDPAAFVQAAQDQSGITGLAADGQNQIRLQAQLGSGSSTLEQSSTLLDSVHALTLQALNGTTSATNFQALSQQVSQAQAQILSLANSKSPDGNFIFGGTDTTQQPFVLGSSGTVSYEGNSGQSAVEVAPGITINAALDGSTFTQAMSGNGYASVTASASNTGDSTLLPVGVTQQSAATAFQQGSTPVTVAFATGASGALNYTATQGGVAISTGAVSSGSDITLNGIQFSLSGAPASGDQFTIAPSRPQSVFALFQSLQTALASPGATTAQTAQTRQVLGNALGTLGQYQDLTTSTNARIGLVLKTAATAATADQTTSTTLQTDQYNQVSANLPAVLTKLNQQTTSLQAALKAYAVVQQTSNLFSLL